MDNYIFVVIIVFNAFFFGGLGILIITNERIYKEDEGGWIIGINLPKLYAKPGDEIDHLGYRKHVGLSIIKFGILLTIFFIIFLLLVDILEQKYLIGIFMLSIFSLILNLVYDIYTKSEKFIKRITSKRTRVDKYLFQLIITLGIINTIPYFFIEDIMKLILVSIFLSLVIGVYYIYKINKLKKQNKEL